MSHKKRKSINQQLMPFTSTQEGSSNKYKKKTLTTPNLIDLIRDSLFAQVEMQCERAILRHTYFKHTFCKRPIDSIFSRCDMYGSPEMCTLTDGRGRHDRVITRYWRDGPQGPVTFINRSSVKYHYEVSLLSRQLVFL